MSDGEKKDPNLNPRQPRKLSDSDKGSHKKQLSEYADAKHSQMSYLDFIITHHPEKDKLIEQLKGCGSWLFFWAFYDGDIQNVVAHKLAGGFTCKKHLHCITCGMRRASRYSKLYEEAMRHVLSLPENSHYVPVLLTYTVKNGADLNERVDHLSQSLQKLLQRRRDSLKTYSRIKNPSCMRHIFGGMGGIEIKKGKNSGLWHPHFHEVALLDSREYGFTEKVVPVRMRKGETEQKYRRIYVPETFKAELTEEWKNLTLDSHQIDVRALYPREKYRVLLPCSEEEAALPLIGEKETAAEDDAIFSGCCEAAKYALKPGELSDADRYYAAETLKGRRLIRSYGCFHGLKLEEDKGDDVDEYLRHLPYYEKVYRYYESTDPNGDNYHTYVLDRIHEGSAIMHRPFDKSKPKVKPIRRPKEISEKLSDFERWRQEYFKDEEPPF